jgi:hypothetical protein
MRIAYLVISFFLLVWSTVAEAQDAPCSRYTPRGTRCFCNHGIVKGHPMPGWIPAGGDYKRKWVRPGFHMTNLKGMHSSGSMCFRD